jgi:hypothetical protein
MAVVINEFEVTPAPAPAPAGPPAKKGDEGQGDTSKKIAKTYHVEHERKRRLAAY